MRIVHLIPAMEEGGVERVVLNLSCAFAAEGEECTVISSGGKLVKELEAAGVSHVTEELKSKNPLTYFTRARRLRRLLQKLKPDLVCAHSRVPAWLFVWANRTLGLPWITYAHGANSVSRYSAVMTKGTATIAPSEFLADFLKANYGEKKIEIIPNGVDLRRFDPMRLDRAFMTEKCREWGIKGGTRVTMALGRITKVKGLDAVIRDFAAKGATGKLIIVGGVDADKLQLLESLKVLVGELKLEDRVVFAGSQTKVAECLALADEVVSGNVTKPESFGLSVVEAYAMNRPVRCLRRFGGTAEVMDAVAALKRSSLRAAVAELYGLDSVVRRTLAFYRQVVGEGVC